MPQIVLGRGAPWKRHLLRLPIELACRRLNAHRTPVLRARSDAFLSGLGISPAIGRYYHVMDVLQNLVGMAGRWGLVGTVQDIGQAVPPACSTLVAWGGASSDGALRHARNFDFAGVGVWERRPAVVFCTPNDGPRYGFVTVHGSDVPCVTAFSEAGLVVTTHTRLHREVTFSGVPIVDLVHDVIRQATTLAKAYEILCCRRIASSWGICVSSASEGRAVSYETHGRAVRPVEAGDGEEFLAVTNRYVDPQMQAGQVTFSPAFVRNSDGRWHYLRRRAAAAALDTGALQQALGAHEDGNPDGCSRAAGACTAQAISVHSVVVEPQAGLLHVSVGPAPTGKGPWATVEWSWETAPGWRLERFEGEVLPEVRAGRYDDGKPAEALAAFVDAAAVETLTGACEQSGQRLEQAIALDPSESAYRFLAGGARLRAGELRPALAHFEAGLELETVEFFRGQLWLWAMRTAAALGEAERAAGFRQALLATGDPLLATHRHVARREQARPLAASRLRRVKLNYDLCDLFL